jgi:hypothetical protein
MKIRIPWLTTVAAGTAVLVAMTAGARPVGALTGVQRLASSTTAITIDGTKAGPTYYGVGAISGGGGNSRLLIDYPDPERSQILDYLFKPDYGAALQLLKLEIGGDANSTDGSEPSVEHVRGQLDCGSGYEWWLAEQAKARNPDIKLYGLQWAAPGWVSGNGTIWTSADIGYVIDWLDCARSHGLSIDYLGGWNEKGYNAAWYEALRAALNANGYGSVQIVAADQLVGPNNAEWSVANAVATDRTFDAAVNIIGGHDPCGYPTTGYTCTISFAARSLGKPDWASEIGAMDANKGAADMVRSVNNGYIQAGLTGSLHWPLVDAMAPGLPYENRGVITADWPWSGHYVVNKMTWAIAQTTQFVGQGWRHVGGANRTLGDSGTYNTYMTADRSQWSMVSENTGHYTGQRVSPQNVKVTIKGGLPAATVRVWATNLWTSDPSKWFMRWKDVHPSAGVFNYTIPPGYVVSFTTSDGQSKGAATSPGVSAMPLPYTATPDSSNEPWGLGAMDGAFEYVPCAGGGTGECIQQMAPTSPVWWLKSTHEPRFPYGVVGSSGWSNYTVSANVLLAGPGSTAGLIGRFSGQAGRGNAERFNGYEFSVAADGSWHVIKNSNANGPTALVSGTVSHFDSSAWHALSFKLSGHTLTASVDGHQVAAITNSAYSAGLAGLESNWTNVQFTNVTAAQ